MKTEKFPLIASSNLALLLAACGGSSDPLPDAGTASATRASPARTLAAIQASRTPPSTAHQLYVSPDGSDSNPGTQARPFRTLQKAADAVTPDSTVHVAPGSYSGNVRIGKSGQESGRIYFVSDEPEGAKIVPASGSSNASAISIGGDHVTVSGFEIDGSNHAGGTKWRIGILSSGSGNSVENNYVHHIATQSGDCTNSGGGGVVADSSSGGKDATIRYNHVHDVGPTTSCGFIHGIYMSTSGTVSHNLVHRVGNGGIHLWHDADRVNVANNTIFNTPRAIVVGTGERYHLPSPGDYFNVTDNILVDNNIGIAEVSDAKGHGTHNQYSGNVHFRNHSNEALYPENRSHVSGTLTVDPQFVDYRKEGGGNYQLKAGSPAAGKGAYQ